MDGSGSGERWARGPRDAGDERSALLRQGVTRLVLEEAARHGWRLPRERLLEVFAADIGLNAMGLESWLDSSP